MFTNETLHRTDLCDRCVGRAVVHVEMKESGLSLHFCNHHYEENRVALHDKISVLEFDLKPVSV